MIKAIWSFRQSTKEDISRADMIQSLFHIIYWKMAHPNHQTILYVDSKFKSKFEEQDILKYWDEVSDLEPMDGVYELLAPSLNTLNALEKDAESYGDEELNFEVPAEKQDGSKNNSLVESDINMALHIANFILPMLGNPELHSVFWKLYAENPYKTSTAEEKVIPSYEEDNNRMNIIGQNGNDGIHYDDTPIEESPSTINKLTNLFKSK